MKGHQLPTIRVGCAGWTVPKEQAHFFPTEGSHLERYASRFNAVEINSSFYRSHRQTTYARWAASVPEEFLFAAKIPKEMTHQQRLVDGGDNLLRFLGEVEGLGNKLGVLLIQLPPSLKFDANVAAQFFETLRSQFARDVSCEPRHESWFTPAVSRLFASFQIGRVASDPAIVPLAAEPGGWTRVAYYRLHGSPRMYYSSYSADYLGELIEKLSEHSDAKNVWCLFDNTASGAATENALNVLKRLRTM